MHIERLTSDVGIFTSTGPLFLAELSRPETRGRILSFQQWSITWGVSETSLNVRMTVEPKTHQVQALIMYYITFGTSYSRTEVVF